MTPTRAAAESEPALIAEIRFVAALAALDLVRLYLVDGHAVVVVPPQRRFAALAALRRGLPGRRVVELAGTIFVYEEAR